MIVWTINDVIGIVLLILIIVASLIWWIVITIKDKLHNIFRKDKANKESEDKNDKRGSDNIL